MARALEDTVVDDLAGRLRAMIVCPNGEPRIDVFEDDRRFYDTLVLSERQSADHDVAPGETDQLGELAAAYEYIRQEISTLSVADQQLLGQYLVERCHVVVIITRDIDRAHLLFTVLNDRGRPLQRKDILKVEVLKSIEPEHELEALARWDAAAGKLGNDFESLFSHIRTIHATGRPQIISAMRTLVRQRGCLPFVTGLLSPMADAFYLVRRFPEAAGRSDQYPELAKALTSLNRFGNADWVAPAMIAMSRFETDPATATRIVCEIDRLTFLLKVLAIGGTKRNKRSSQLIQALTRGNELDVEQAFSITREEMRAVAFHLRDIHRRNAGLAKLILMRIEDELAGTPLLLSTTELTIEHILPQRPAPASDWRRLFGDRREACQNSLGNLALVPPRLNERMRNKEFAEKLSIFASGDARALPALRTNDDIVEAIEWGPDQVWAREARLLQVLSQLWRIDGLGVARDAPNSARARVNMA
ncbi:MAG: HNH endonuclease family protein [Hyphomicrobiaceae bacterium]|nr:HNH endonuclease family protein [Hyphomicrobiaceae bacterium]